jgi:LPS-assembly protein
MPQANKYLLVFCLALACLSAFAQTPVPTPRPVAPPATTNAAPDRIDRKVDNPIGYAEEQRKAERQGNLKAAAQTTATAASDLFDIVSEEQETQGDLVIAAGNVQATGNGMLVIADRVTFNKATNDLVAEGNVYFEQEGQKLVGERLELNIRTKRGSVFSPTGFTNRTPDGTSITIDAARADKTGLDTFNLEDTTLTACNEKIPKWSFTAKRARIRVDHRAKVYNAFFRIKGVPILWVPYASVSISKKDRSSGFLLPSSGQSNIKGRTFHLAYYQTLGRSADILLRGDFYSKRGYGLGFDFRARTNETSHVYFGSFLVFDQRFGVVRDQNGNVQPDASGSSFYAEAVHNFKNGFTAVADVNITSSFNFRNVFAENVATAISPEERSIFYLNKNWRSYSFNALFGEQSFFIGNQIVKVRQFPAAELNKRATKISLNFPVYFSLDTSLGGVRRSETSGDRTFLKSPSIVQRLDFFPRLTFPLKSVAGFTLTPSVALRSTFYSDSLASNTRTVTGQNLLRNYVDFTADLRAPSLAKVFKHRDGQPWFKHVIEPYAVYRRLAGIDDFTRFIRADERDAIAETNEVEYGITNKFFTRRKSADGKSTQAHEWLDVTLAQKYFFDPTFGGAFQPCPRAVFDQSPANCVRNQFFPINTLTGFASGGIRRNLSPLNARARLRPNNLIFGELRLNYDTMFGALREIVMGGGLSKGPWLLSNNWYYTRRVRIDELRYGLPIDPSSLPGNQTDVSAFYGNPLRGLYVGSSLVYDLRRKQLYNSNNLIFLQAVGGYSWDCCSLQVQRFSFNAGQRFENRYIFSFTLKGVGTFGTQNIGQRRN